MSHATSASTSRPTLAVRIRRLLITGLLTLIPAALTVWIVVRLFQLMDGAFAPLLYSVVDRWYPGVRIPGLGAALTLTVILTLGWLSTNVFGKRLIVAVERLIDKIPVAKSVYSSTKGIVGVFSEEQREAFKRVILIRYPHPDTFAMAFVTGSARWGYLHPELGDLLMVFLPTTPNPTGGYLLMVPRKDTIDLPISVEAGVRMVISGGILVPDPKAVPAGDPQPG
ncbi:MAG: DUF502 domain-containing protein [Thermoanaerobaculia bacterium]|nr:DUF502 domain-containing protein [Thermoanaerobaculia bacterium]